MARTVKFPTQTTSDDYLVPAKDTRGESTRVWTRVQPSYDRQLSVIVNSRQFPFKTPGDVVRWCIHMGLKHLEKQTGLPSVTTQAEMMKDFLVDEDRAQQFGETMGLMTKVIERFVADGDAAEARRVVAKLRVDILAMPSGYWKRKYEKHLLASFGNLLDGRQQAVPVGAFRPADEEDTHEQVAGTADEDAEIEDE